MNCKSCRKPCSSVNIDETGTLGKCGHCGDWTFDATRTSSTSINVAGIQVTGACAIGPGAVAIGNVGGKKDKKKGRR
ncbi:hypothetical protein [Micromonospora carbonacea]|uniref:hypothetical protein n=1 Tax=Micromonospora carbonacea TaxID=47853 RepID=UPI0033E6F90B